MDSTDLKDKNRIVYTRRPRKKPSQSQSEQDAAAVIVPPVSKPESPPKSNDEVEKVKTPSPLDNAKKTPHNAPTTSASESDFVQIVKPLVETRIEDDKVVFKLFKETPKDEIERLGKRLEDELKLVRLLVERLDAKKKALIDSDNQEVDNNVEMQRGGEDFIDNRVVVRGNNSVQETRPMGLSRDNSMVYVGPDNRDVLDFQPQRGGEDFIDNRVLVRVNNSFQESRPMTLARDNSNVIHGNNSMVYVGADNRDVGGYSNNDFQQQRGEEFMDNRVPIRINSYQESRPMGLSRINSDMGAMRNLEPVPYHRQLSVAVNRRESEYVEKEKRTPKANQYYPNSEFLLGKDRLPPESNNKRTKLNNGRKHIHGLGFSSKIKGRCNTLLQKLMKHKFGWVFNVPVDAKTLNLADYHIIIQYPMDLGTIKARLSQNRYTSPVEFAEDVRLVFRNAMTYNPKGHDVHVMAEELSQMFEERWAVIETEYNMYLNGGQMYHDLPTPTPAQSHFPRTIAVNDVLARSESMIPNNMVVELPKIQYRPPIVRTPVPKKPKARDINKRDMTYDEKQKLSSHLQGLPSEKLDAIVQIIKRRNTALSQHDDEIEVDIDNVDAETLWELDRFVTNYKKSLSKNKRKAELARQVGNGTIAAPTVTGPAVTTAMHLEQTAFGETGERPSVDGQTQRNNDSRSSSSSSSSSDSGSSSDSDSDSSSADGSSHSPKT